MAQFTVNERRARSVAASLARLTYRPDDFAGLTPFPEDPFRERHFIFFLAAIDHNTHGAERYQAELHGTFLHGSDLMYALAKEAAKRAPDLFTPQYLVGVAEQELASIFRNAEGWLPVGMARRADLVRDAAGLLLERYGGDLDNLFREAGGCLRRSAGGGILARLAEIKAYADPLEKKSFLLVKLLRRRGLLTVRDPEQMKVPLDHVLYTMALRSGLVGADAATQGAILSGALLSEAALLELRSAALAGYDLVAQLSGLPVDQFDDLLWAYGRECLRYPAPLDPELLCGIAIDLDRRLAGSSARDAFLLVLNGLDPEAPESARLYPVPVVPDTWFF
ncbi:hypothetical protein GMLC_09320 [Geomonas limicola]|uniref:Uncharacterized protein n=1 Tax=Geomonas limicola TaxID=2740186 RepID=A0A6V8N731_9BACT|nr:queuosine salvage family protein [Geomonas limicola]GFO67353.1 hypothetical protein GMLC_09320 [Geomonas limicola]